MAKRKMPEKIVDTVNEVESTPIPICGIVSGCKRLNVRIEPSKNASVVAEIDENTKLDVFLDESTGEWYKVRTDKLVDGFCMKKFITIKRG